MTVDVRGFTDPLQALRCRQQWQLDKAQAALGRAQVALDEARADWSARQTQHARAMRHLALTRSAQIDPARHRNVLAWLAESDACLRRHDDQVRESEDCRDAWRRQCRQLQLQIDLGEHHRQACLHEFRARVLRRLANDADANWLSGSLWRDLVTQAHAAWEPLP